MDDLPDPDDPTIATDYPCFILRFNFLSTWTLSLVGYENTASLN